jgi:hypothetical protein
MNQSTAAAMAAVEEQKQELDVAIQAARVEAALCSRDRCLLQAFRPCDYGQQGNEGSAVRVLH